MTIKHKTTCYNCELVLMNFFFLEKYSCLYKTNKIFSDIIKVKLVDICCINLNKAIKTITNTNKSNWNPKLSLKNIGEKSKVNLDHRTGTYSPLLGTFTYIQFGWINVVQFNYKLIFILNYLFNRTNSE